MRDKCVIFDLDDTLMYEIDYLKSAYQEIAKKISIDEYDAMISLYRQGKDVFLYLEQKFGIEKQILLNMYREHFPNIVLTNDTLEVLNSLHNKGYILGLITDGRSVTQRNKIKALGIENFFSEIVISEEFGTEKPNRKNYEIFHQYSVKDYFYIGDNIKKDFITPNCLGWKTICLLNQGYNIHSQDFEKFTEEYQPHYKIKNIKKVLSIIL
ncbi:HAD family hydrolase [Bergeyella zoohelcum]|uniref:HAD hydrolase, family IA n=1 Tax=Bergeyella zoohelcum ATCC 43767 TaxID=883096 RepID=K1MHD6_9FLAO|nr:HAD-IA family hydrolase [Bergeyella zoohelcum]EKB55414.1 HAD hydrolase, family IA [Bergeyella zoohelcum ATCC 43767]SUV50193.1 Pyrimidine 5'-nucleotidase YjjG [Bergeyella zoohelcum]